jgi:hypothetical protein
MLSSVDSHGADGLQSFIVDGMSTPDVNPMYRVRLSRPCSSRSSPRRRCTVRRASGGRTSSRTRRHRRQTYPILHRIAWSSPALPDPDGFDEHQEFLFGLDRILDGVQTLIGRG